ncbi:DNase I-like protein [Dichomitus squalens]|uniref:DNase I-like protein n=2 Tax=Dichomitus squalens TaxID=114155 RepID=A0A4Q9QBR6_9APHY|nr:DNase I-like protein [Dichomitus squalens LYAD-421 SS1]EJF60073.1 DNase I-like protein [Dichomitus squalens LYAD-421 SS1]TBU43955.1 DNase I-like protein [Dichomitus squalens]TBU65153.1 DNase I-like protein [Dichomitus squalens]
MSEVDLQPSTSTATPPPERKQFGAHLPPPTRTIALGDKLPPPRRVNDGSSSDEEDDEDVKMKVDLLPDASRASRRPPVVDCLNYSEFNIHIPAYTGSVAVSGHAVAVVTQHHLRVYDLSISDAPIWNLDSKNGDFNIKIKDFKMTSVEFRPTTSLQDRGAFLWIGTKDGHLIELDVRTGQVTAARPAVHAHTITHMFRHDQSMVTLDDTGKVLVWSPSDDLDLDLSTQTPRVVRIAEKQEFAKMIGGQLWTSTRDPSAGGSVPGTSRGPYMRVYDVFTQGSVGRSLLPSEHLGAVTAATVLPSDPAQAYVAHEGGHISIWALGGGDAPPQCVEVVKVSTSDILSLEGVNDRLWAGGRKGTISAYDVGSKPWTVTNSWMAHQSLPVLRIGVDTWSMEKLDRLMVFSVGRDERLRFWDGLLGVDWIEQELLKRETEFSTFRDMTVLIVSWNVDSAKPDTLTGPAENVNFLQDVLRTIDRPDIIAFGMQELIDLESRKMAAKTVLLGGKNKTADGSISQKVTTSYKKWYDRLVLAVRLAMPADEPYTVIHTENLVGLFTCVLVKNSERTRLKHAALTTVKRGMGGRYGNKGGIISRFVVDDTSICFINCHLAAGQHHVRQRNADAAAIVEDQSMLPEPDEGAAYVNGGDGTMVLDHELVFMNGDMNYRIDQRREAVVAAVKAGDLQQLVIHDQLRKEMKFNRAFRLRTFQEGPLDFAPTYKYDRRSDEYDTSEKARTPAWCDRVLWRSLVPERVELLHYRRWEANVSDHRPISAGFKIRVKSVKHEARARVKAEVQERWKEAERDLLAAAMQYYIDQKMI